MTASTTNKKLFSLRDMIWLLSLVITFSASYFPMKIKVDRMSDILDKYNLETINYRLNDIQEDVDDLKTKLDSFISEFWAYARESGNRRQRNTD